MHLQPSPYSASSYWNRLESSQAQKQSPVRFGLQAEYHCIQTMAETSTEERWECESSSAFVTSLLGSSVLQWS